MQSMSGSLKTGFFSLNFSNIVGATIAAYCANFLRKPAANAVRHRAARAQTLIFASFSRILIKCKILYLYELHLIKNMHPPGTILTIYLD